ncbi:hypothetical protein B0H17DRAFT_1184088 [Mycena rosella]|uniref:Uncharacterized protein n=1 Tax=Mycena rosella TaxID=1033263 RepID=A0AAD7CXH9_MYCRO|nr:hypothetical protein B0H17DRAFT_1184088 [Mycena rosella]
MWSRLGNYVISWLSSAGKGGAAFRLSHRPPHDCRFRPKSANLLHIISCRPRVAPWARRLVVAVNDCGSVSLVTTAAPPPSSWLSADSTCNWTHGYHWMARGSRAHRKLHPRLAVTLRRNRFFAGIRTRLRCPRTPAETTTAPTPPTPAPPRTPSLRPTREIDARPRRHHPRRTTHDVPMRACVSSLDTGRSRIHRCALAVAGRHPRIRSFPAATTPPDAAFACIFRLLRVGISVLGYARVTGVLVLAGVILNTVAYSSSVNADARVRPTDEIDAIDAPICACLRASSADTVSSASDAETSSHSDASSGSRPPPRAPSPPSCLDTACARPARIRLQSSSDADVCALCRRSASKIAVKQAKEGIQPRGLDCTLRVRLLSVPGWKTGTKEEE